MFDKANLILLCLFLFGHYPESYFENRGENGSHRKVKADLDSLRQELSVRGLEFGIALSVHVCVLGEQSSCKRASGMASMQAYISWGSCGCTTTAWDGR